jgi:signal transduction histidine kinase
VNGRFAEAVRRLGGIGAKIGPTWVKPGLFALGALMVVVFALYTMLVIRTLREDAQRVATLYAERIFPIWLAAPGVSSSELGVLFDLIQEMPFAVIVTTEDGIPSEWRGISVPDTARSPEAYAEVMRIARDIDRVLPPRDVVIPLPNGASLTYTIHVAESAFLRRIAMMPVVAAVVTLLFTSVTLWGFWQLKTGEQQAVWVGMAKETAHQLGTPLSSLSGWLEILADHERTGDALEVETTGYSVVGEMSHDVDRLKKIAQRFSQVGSPPELSPEPVNSVLDETITYFNTRIPRLGRDATIERIYRADEEVPLSRELLGWAFENLLKNSLDALSRTDRASQIRISTERVEDRLRIVFEDNGKGASSTDLRKMFQPGFSTKKRGWGLGLTFVKRIIEDYHGGEVNALSPGPDQGMMIEIFLPVRT